MKSTQKPYKHHTVTQALMRLHSSDGRTHKNKENYRIFLFDKRTLQIDEPRIKDIVYEENFYDCTELDGTHISLEGQLKTWEDVFIPIIKKVCHSRSVRTALLYERELSYFVASQQIRTGSFRRTHQMTWEMLNKIDTEKGLPTLEPTPSVMAVAHSRFMRKYIPAAAAMIARKRWVLLHNATKLPFWISDECDQNPWDAR